MTQREDFGFVSDGETFLYLRKIEDYSVQEVDLDPIIKKIEYILEFFESRCSMGCCGMQSLDISMSGMENIFKYYTRNQVVEDIKTVLFDIQSLGHVVYDSEDVLQMTFHNQDIVDFLNYLLELALSENIEETYLPVNDIEEKKATGVNTFYLYSNFSIGFGLMHTRESPTPNLYDEKYGTPEHIIKSMSDNDTGFFPSPVELYHSTKSVCVNWLC